MSEGKGLERAPPFAQEGLSALLDLLARRRRRSYRCSVILLIMAWSPVRRSNAGISRVANPGDYTTPNSNHLRDGLERAISEAAVATPKLQEIPDEGFWP
jgi:hypothetical protein